VKHGNPGRKTAGVFLRDDFADAQNREVQRSKID
jgi:hypothetical protein